MMLDDVRMMYGIVDAVRILNSFSSKTLSAYIIHTSPYRALPRAGPMQASKAACGRALALIITLLITLYYIAILKLL